MIFVVPAGVKRLQITAVGAPGYQGDAGTAPGGRGGVASTTVRVRPGSTLYVEVGGAGARFLTFRRGGWNGSGDPGYSGGGASDVRTISCGLRCATGGSVSSLRSRLVVAGGGGGGGNLVLDNGSPLPSATASAGGDAGAPGAGGADDPAGDTGGGGGGAGTLAEGGGGGAAGVSVVQASYDGLPGHDGSLGSGGYGGSGSGGGGYYGGGGGGLGGAHDCGCGPSGGYAGGGGGGGGSSYAPGGTTGVAASLSTPPSVTISYRASLPSNSCLQIVGTLEKLTKEKRRLAKAKGTLATERKHELKTEIRQLEKEERTSCPAIKGRAAVGKTLHATPGHWSGKPTSFTYRWLSCNKAGKNCFLIVGAIGQADRNTYTVVQADAGHTLRVQVTARNAAGSSRVESLPTRVVP